jgi:hypothetical protein
MKLAKTTVRIASTLFFVLSTGLFAYQVFLAAQGQKPEYNQISGALIVAGIATGTWVAMFGAIRLKMTKSGVDFLATLALGFIALGVDLYIAIAQLAPAMVIPPHLPLLIVIGHVVTHVTQWVIPAIAEAISEGTLSKHYESPEDAQRRQEARIQELEWKLESALEKSRTYSWVCPDCGWETEKTSQESLNRAMRTHRAQWCTSVTTAKQNGHKHEPVPAGRE